MGRVGRRQEEWGEGTESGKSGEKVGRVWRREEE